MAKVATDRDCLSPILIRPTDNAPAGRGSCRVNIETRQFADAVVASVAGRIDHRSAAAFEDALAPLLQQAGAARGGLVLDFSGVDYISSVGLRVLMLAARNTQQSGAKLALAAPQSVVAEIFAISRFDRILVLCPSVPAALAKVSAAALAAHDAAAPSA